MECNLTSAMLREENIQLIFFLQNTEKEHITKTYSWLHACVQIQTHAEHTHTCPSMHTHTCLDTHTHTHIFMYTQCNHTHTHTRARTWIHIHTLAHTHTYTMYTHTHTRVLPTCGTLQTTPQRRKTREKTWKPVSMGLDFTSPTALCKIWTGKWQNKLLKDHLNNKKMVTQAPLKTK